MMTSLHRRDTTTDEGEHTPLPADLQHNALLYVDEEYAPALRHAIARRVLTEFLIALRFLTLVGLWSMPSLGQKSQAGHDDGDNSFGRAGVFFPLIGLLLGAFVWGANTVLQPLIPSPLILSVVLVGLLAVLSRGLQLEGVARSTVGLFSRAEHSQRLALMQERAFHVSGIIVLLALLGLKILALSYLSSGYRAAALLLAPMLGRWACVVMAYSSRPARTEGLGALFVNGVEFREFGVASVMTLGVVFTLVEVGGLLLFLGLAGIIICWILYCNRRLDGVTGDTIGALGEIVETVSVCMFSVLEAVVRSL